MTNVDSQRIREIRDNTKAMAEAFSSIASTLAEALELYVSTQTETQNSNLTFEKRTMRDCYNCKRYETEGECVECHYEPKDECAKEYEELGLKELKELIEADRKTENSSEIPNNSTISKMEQVDKDINVRSKAIYDKWGNVFDARTDIDDEPPCDTCKHYNPHHEAIACERCLEGKYSRYEPQTERSE